MPTPPLLPGDIEAVTFDCYGTLIDWETGIRAFVAPHLERENESRHTSRAHAHEASAPMAPTVEDWLARWEPIQFELLTPYRPYAEVLVRSLEETNWQFAMPNFMDAGPGLVRSLPGWPAFPDTVSSLRRIGRRRRVGIISNIDRDLMAQTLGTLLAPLSLVVTAEDVKAYKPDPAPFAFALEKLQLAPERVLHAAFGWRYDLTPAHALGLRTCWVNRGNAARPVGDGVPAPDLEVSSLSALADWLG